MNKVRLKQEDKIIIAACHMVHRKQLHKGEAVCIEVLINSGDLPRERSRGKFMRYLEQDLFPSKRQSQNRTVKQPRSMG